MISLSDESRIDEIQPALFEKVFAADLHIAVVWLAASILSVYLPGLNETPIKTVLIVPGLLFLPGYCLIAALFPGYSDIDLHERIALSIGLSVAVVPLIAFGLNFTPFGIRLDPVLITVTIFTLVMILVAYYRRAASPLSGTVVSFIFQLQVVDRFLFRIFSSGPIPMVRRKPSGISRR